MPEALSFGLFLCMTLSARPKTSCRITELSEHEADGGETEECKRAVVAVFPVAGQTPASVEPCDGPLDDPALGFNDEALRVLASLDDLHRQARHRLGGAVLSAFAPDVTMRCGQRSRPMRPAGLRARRLHDGDGAVGGGWRGRAGCDACGGGERRGAGHSLDRTDRPPRMP
jgi:hypothetical protein